MPYPVIIIVIVKQSQRQKVGSKDGTPLETMGLRTRNLVSAWHTRCFEVISSFRIFSLDQPVAFKPLRYLRFYCLHFIF